LGGHLICPASNVVDDNKNYNSVNSGKQLAKKTRRTRLELVLTNKI
jgi:hypothetical protein